MAMRTIQSVVKIKDFPSFVDFKPEAGLPNFSRFNLIYGWNGSGKTTLSRIFRAFELGANPSGDTARPAKFEFKLSDGTSISEETLSDFKSIRVFNKDFIDDTVFCNDGPKPIFFLGKESKEAQENINKAEAEIKTFTDELTSKKRLCEKAKTNRDKLISNKARDIKNALMTTGSNDKYRNYDKGTLERDMREHGERLASPTALVLDNLKLGTLSKSILEKTGQNLNPPVTPDFDLSGLEAEVKEVLSRAVVSKVIEALKSDDEVGKWVEHGLHIHKTKDLDTCQFCNQTIPSARLTDLENHFNDAYQKTMEAIALLKKKCSAREIKIEPIDSSSFYEEFVPLYVAERENSQKAVKAHNSRLTEFVEALEKKEKNVFTNPVLPNSGPINTEAFFKINDLINKNNEKTKNFLQQNKVEKETLELHYIAEFMPTYSAAENEGKTLEGETKVLEGKIKETQKVLDSAKESLRNHHTPAKEINENLQRFLGRSDIQIKSVDFDGGFAYEIKREDKIAENLSEGERTALAIAYFISKIKEDGFDLKDSVIVIDDPVSSLDSNAIFQAFSFLREATKDAEQLFILTHHFDFFRQVKNWFRYSKGEFFMLVCKDDGGIRESHLTKIDKLLVEYESEYHFLFSVLYRFSEKKETDLEQMYSMPNVARKFLESFLAFRVPILEKPEPNIRYRLKEIVFDETKKTRINRFVETHSHPRYESGIQDFDMTILSETPAIIADLMELVKTEDEKHYNFLVKSLAS
jgi:wobble nucleotide-excising tRNase